MVKISAFADEISDDLHEQIGVMQREGVGYIELRSVWGTNVLKLSTEQVKEIKARASDAGIGFSAVGSPLGKFPLDGKLSDQIEALKRALEYAGILESPYIRMFSFYIPEGDDPSRYRNQVIDWLGEMIKEAEKSDNAILAHENEKGIYGDTGQRCLDLYETLESESFTGIFDFANYVQCGQKPYEDCWSLVKQHITYFHVKDSRLSDGAITPAGQGDGDVEKILAEACAEGFDNFLTLEPHLSVAGANYGRTDSELFHTAVESLRDVLAGAEK